MQEKNHTNVKEILLALAEHVNVKGIRGLAEYLGTTESRLYAWIGREKIGGASIILSKIPHVRLEWLKTGEGPMLFAEYAGHDGVMIPSTPREPLISRTLTVTPLQLEWIETGLKMGDLEMLEWLVEIKKKQGPPKQ